MKAKYLFAAALLAMTGCGGEDATTGAGGSTETPANPTSESVASLPDGAIEPGRYRHLVVGDCEGVKDDPIACPGAVPAPPLGIDVSVPEGWVGSNEFHLLEPAKEGNSGPNGAGLVLGWTTHPVGLNSDPCLPEGQEIPDVEVGPSVDDFVDAVQAQKGLRVSKPQDVRLGGYDGRYFTLRGPADISRCDHWRPWDPGFYAQGENNLWEVWVMDVDGRRTLIVTERFPDTPATVVTQLREMAESVTFEPNV